MQQLIALKADPLQALKHPFKNLDAGLADEEHRAMLESDYAAIGKLTGLADGQYATNHTVKAYDK